jgi:hypothetical protein
VRHLPVPFVAIWEDGRANYTAMDPRRKAEIITRRLCHVCGRPLGKVFVFLGAEVSAQPGGFYVDPPLHERCAELSAAGWCPFISNEQVPRRPPDSRDVTISPAGQFEGPKLPWVMAYTGSFIAALAAGYGAAAATEVFLPGPILRTRRFEYRGGRLAAVTP